MAIHSSSFSFFPRWSRKDCSRSIIDAGRWSWDPTRIHAKGYTDNVVDLMVGKLSRLPINTQKALQQLACLGNSAERALLAMVREGSKEALDRDLEEALRAGLVLPSGDAYRFLHDRVQEAAYSQIPEARARRDSPPHREAAGGAHVS